MSFINGAHNVVREDKRAAFGAELLHMSLSVTHDKLAVTPSGD